MDSIKLLVLEELWRKDPQSRVFLRLAEELRKSGQYERAIAVCKEGLPHHQDYVPALVSLGRSNQALGRDDDAERVFSRVLELAPDNTHALRGLGSLLAEKGRYEEALGYLETLLLHEPSDEEIPLKIEEIKSELESTPTQQLAMTDSPTFSFDQGLTEDVEYLDDESPELQTEDHPDEGVLDQPFAKGHFPLEDAPDSPAPAANAGLTEEIEYLEDEDFEPSTEELPLHTEASNDLSRETPDPPLFATDSGTLTMDSDLMEDAEFLEDTALNPGMVNEMNPVLATDWDGVSADSTSIEPSGGYEDEENTKDLSLATLEVEFERVAEATGRDSELFQDAEDDADLHEVAENTTPVPNRNFLNSSALEDMITIGLKHEKMEHLEKARAVYLDLLESNPSDDVKEHLDRVTQLLASETPEERKIRVLSNWLDKIKGVYHVP